MHDGSLLDAREERAYRLLVGLSAAKAADLAEVAELPQHEAAEVLQRLQAKGLSRSSPPTNQCSGRCRRTWPSVRRCSAVRSHSRRPGRRWRR